MAGNWSEIILSRSGGGTYVTPPDAPNVTSSVDPVIYWEQYGHDWKWGITWVLGLPNTDPAYANLRLVDVQMYGPDSSVATTPQAPIYAGAFPTTGPFTYSYKSNSIPINPDYQPHVFVFKAYAVNDLGIASTTPLTKTVTVTPPAVTAVAVSEHTSSRVADANRGLTCTLDVPVTLALGTTPGPQFVTIWLKYGNGVITIEQGGWPALSGTGSTVSLPGVWVTTLASTTVTVYCCAGAVNAQDGIPSYAASGTFSMGGPATSAS